jgi:hypothetical protein
MWTSEVAGVLLTRQYVSHIWLFEGAEGGKWLSDFEATQTQAAQISDGVPGAGSSPTPSVAVGDAPRDAKRARML